MKLVFGGVVSGDVVPMARGHGSSRTSGGRLWL